MNTLSLILIISGLNSYLIVFEMFEEDVGSYQSYIRQRDLSSLLLLTQDLVFSITYFHHFSIRESKKVQQISEIMNSKKINSRVQMQVRFN